MTLGDKQRQFVRDVADLITHAYGLGFEMTFGDAYRSPEQALANAAAGTGISKSLHTQRLAIDLNLFVSGVYQTDSAAYEPVGVFWESIRPGNAWGGRFNDKDGKPKPDGNHFSAEHDGRK